MRIKAPFSYYGGKSKIAHLYPKPEYRLIIEPFAGSGAYSWLHRDGHDVHVNDLDPKTFSMWQFLTSDEASNLIQYLPDTVEPGMKVSEMLGDLGRVYPGFLEVCRAEANQGTQGARGVHDQITSMGAKCWKVRRKLEHVIPAVANWKVTNVDYQQLPDVEATWFIDPPYQNPAGARYRQSAIDYTALAAWCRSRRGQVIVCENAGANWLDFQPMAHPRVSIRSLYQKADAREVIWTNDPQPHGIPLVCNGLDEWIPL